MRSKTAWLGLGVNLAYGVYSGILGVLDRSWWFLTLAAYYIVLSVMQFAVLCAAEKVDTERFLSRFIGIMCLFLAVTLAGTAYLSVSGQHGTQHHEIVMITIALYAFVKISMAIINLAKTRKNARPALKCLRNLSLAHAAVSIFALQRSMLVTFEGMSAEHIRIMNALTGTAVYLLVAVLGINLIGGKHVTMAKSKLVQANEKIAEAVTGGYEKIEKGVVDGCKKIEEGVVKGYTKLEDKFIDRFLTHEGETVEDAKERLKKEK